MRSFVNRLLRGAVLGVMLLVAATANLVSFSYDADGDDETPPVNVELSIVAPNKKLAHVVRQHAPARRLGFEVQGFFIQQPASLEFESQLPLDMSSPQFVVPLRS
jgi:hypothetical protein